jgi:hypothetical protein
MFMNRRKKKASPVEKTARALTVPGYNSVLSDVVELLDAARRASARTVNAIMTATYWELGRRIVEYEQAGRSGPIMARSLSRDFPAIWRHDSTRPERNLRKCRAFYHGG